MDDHDQLYPKATRALADERTRLAPPQAKAFAAFSHAVFADGALDALTKQSVVPST